MKGHMTAEANDAAMKVYLREIGRIPLLTPEQEIELAGKIRNGDRDARTLMINSNLRLVVTIAQDYANRGLPLLDVIAEGNIGLMTAVDRFDPSRGAKLSTCCVVDQTVDQTCFVQSDQDDPFACSSRR